jgi:hypothetical protein
MAEMGGMALIAGAGASDDAVGRENFVPNEACRECVDFALNAGRRVNGRQGRSLGGVRFRGIAAPVACTCPAFRPS